MFKTLTLGVVFLLSVAVFLTHVVPFTYLGISLPLFFFLLWGLVAPLPKHLALGVLAGAVIDAYGVPLFGTHALLFLVLGIFLFFGKMFFKTRYFLGDAMLVGGGLVTGEVVFYATLWLTGFQAVVAWFSYALLLERALVFAVLAGFLYLVLRRWYETAYIESTRYVV